MQLPLPAELRKVIEELPANTEALVSRLDRVVDLLEELVAQGRAGAAGS